MVAETKSPGCSKCGPTHKKLNEIHEAIVGTTEKSGLVGRTEKLEKNVSTTNKIIGAALFGIVGFAFQVLTKNM